MVVPGKFVLILLKNHCNVKPALMQQNNTRYLILQFYFNKFNFEGIKLNRLNWFTN